MKFLARAFQFVGVTIIIANVDASYGEAASTITGIVAGVVLGAIWAFNDNPTLKKKDENEQV